MNLLYDYYYRFPQDRLHLSGRCRVRIYKRGNGTHTVLLSELNSNSGESITSACERIAKHLVALKGLNPKTTRWIQNDLPDDGERQTFDELTFDWTSDNIPSAPHWKSLDEDQIDTLTGDSTDGLSQQIGDVKSQNEERVRRDKLKTERVA